MNCPHCCIKCSKLGVTAFNTTTTTPTTVIARAAGDTYPSIKLPFSCPPPWAKYMCNVLRDKMLYVLCIQQGWRPHTVTTYIIISAAAAAGATTCCYYIRPNDQYNLVTVSLGIVPSSSHPSTWPTPIHSVTSWSDPMQLVFAHKIPWTIAIGVPPSVL